ncbi:MAG: hypothetical protein WDZ79_02905 [Candidatus Paceibacterota bacterium]
MTALQVPSSISDNPRYYGKRETIYTINEKDNREVTGEEERNVKEGISIRHDERTGERIY